MAQCEVCGNDYDRAFTLTQDGSSHTFDSFECAIHAMAPSCAHCGCRIMGHGMESNGEFYCCAQCAHHTGATSMTDRA
jgi:phage terminase large subunit GpA-like protein